MLLKYNLFTCDQQALAIQLHEIGLSLADGGQTLFVESTEHVKVQVEFNGTKEAAKIEPLQWVCLLLES